MSDIFYLIVTDNQNNDHQISYQLADNPIAHSWFKKLKKIYRVPLDKNYTTFVDVNITEQQLSAEIIDDIKLLNEKINLSYPIKEILTAEDCNRLHAITVDQQYNYSTDIREIFHHMHKKLHVLETVIYKKRDSWLSAGWAEKEGLLKTTFDKDPYQYYVSGKLGNLYLTWTEFGKTPYGFWKDKDTDTADHFFKTCKPHLTFRVQFSLCINEINNYNFEQEFENWFDKYRKKWQELYNTSWTPIQHYGGILLAEPTIQINFENLITIKSVSV
jgi:hypothetical protein